MLSFHEMDNLLAQRAAITRHVCGAVQTVNHWRSFSTTGASTSRRSLLTAGKSLLPARIVRRGFGTATMGICWLFFHMAERWFTQHFLRTVKTFLPPAKTAGLRSGAAPRESCWLFYSMKATSCSQTSRPMAGEL